MADRLTIQSQNHHRKVCEEAQNRALICYGPNLVTPGAGEPLREPYSLEWFFQDQIALAGETQLSEAGRDICTPQLHQDPALFEELLFKFVQLLTAV